jgi:uncharacterized glyoxalase superfamily protein PhnB
MTCKQIVPELTVESVENSIRFYEEVLQFRLVARAPEMGVPSWAEVENGSARIMFQAKSDMFAEMPVLATRPIGGTMIIVLRMDSKEGVRTAWQKLQSSMVNVLPLRETDYGTAEFAVQDPDGYVVLIAG